MQSLDKVLPALEHLKELVDQYNTIKYDSSDETSSLSEQIPQVYGSVQEVYRHFSGDLKIDVPDRNTVNTYYNYFEAGYLSGRSIHEYQGRQELLKIIGIVRAEIEFGESNADKNYHFINKEAIKDLNFPKSLHIDNKYLSIKERFESHPLIFGISLVVVGFLAGFGVNEWTMVFRGKEATITDLSKVAAQVESLTQEHNNRLKELHTELRENEKQAVYGGNLDSSQKKHTEAAQRLRGSIEEENNAYKMHLEQLMKIVNINDIKVNKTE